jgi:hypothetical protein
MRNSRNCLFVFGTLLILTLMAHVPSVSGGGSRRKIGGYGLDRRGRQRLPIRPDGRPIGRKARKKASGKLKLYCKKC